MVYKSILIPIDGSDEADRAGEEGLELAEALGAQVHVISVVDTNIPASESPKQGELLRKESAERVEELAEKGRDRGLDVTESVEVGVTSEEIVEYADENADVIVMGTQGRGGIERVLLGSVADKVVRTSPVPVLTVRPESTS